MCDVAYLGRELQFCLNMADTQDFLAQRAERRMREAAEWGDNSGAELSARSASNAMEKRAYFRRAAERYAERIRECQTS